MVLAEATQLWSDVLSRKRYFDITGNTINHPNDWGHRLLAQLHMELLWSPATPVQARPAQAKWATAERMSIRIVSLSGKPTIAVSTFSFRMHDARIGVYDIRGRLVCERP